MWVILLCLYVYHATIMCYILDMYICGLYYYVYMCILLLVVVTHQRSRFTINVSTYYNVTIWCYLYTHWIPSTQLLWCEDHIPLFYISLPPVPYYSLIIPITYYYSTTNIYTYTKWVRQLSVPRPLGPKPPDVIPTGCVHTDTVVVSVTDINVTLSLTDMVVT